MTKKKTKTPKLTTVTNITEAVAQQDQMVAKVQCGQFGVTPQVTAPIAMAARAALLGCPSANTTEPPKRRKGRARCYHLDQATKVTKALLTIQHQRTSIMAIDGWHARLRKVHAAQHAANAFAADALERRLIPNGLYEHAMGLTVARCMDYKVTSEEAADLIQLAIEKKVAEVNCPNG